jgi:siroheme synthase (precorrin-2 oxidase/ferrochelatase)
MNATTGKTKIKRPSKGQRKHNRLVKQEARKASIPVNVANKPKVSA